jgi:hypothetical protein
MKEALSFCEPSKTSLDLGQILSSIAFACVGTGAVARPPGASPAGFAGSITEANFADGESS